MESQRKQMESKIIEYLQDGSNRTIKEIEDYLAANGIEIKKESGVLRSVLFSLKRKNDSLKNISKGVYRWEKNDKETIELKEVNNLNCDFSDFITILPLKNKKELVVSVFQDGTVSVNSQLLKFIDRRKVDLKLKKDGSNMAILINENENIDFGKNGRIKNYNVLTCLEKNKKNFPVYYVGNWNEEGEFWIGAITSKNPNKQKNNHL